MSTDAGLKGCPLLSGAWPGVIRAAGQWLRAGEPDKGGSWVTGLCIGWLAPEQRAPRGQSSLEKGALPVMEARHLVKLKQGVLQKSSVKNAKCLLEQLVVR